MFSGPDLFTQHRIRITSAEHPKPMKQHRVNGAHLSAELKLGREIRLIT